MNKLNNIYNLDNGIKTGIVLILALILLSNVASATVYRWVPSDNINVATGIITNWGNCGDTASGYAITLLTTASTSGCTSDTYHESGAQDPAVDMFFNTAYTVNTNVQGNWYYGRLKDTSRFSIDVYTFRLIYANPDGTVVILPGNGSVTIPNAGNVDANYNISLTDISGTVPAGAKLGLRISKTGNSVMKIYFGDLASIGNNPSGYFSVTETPSVSKSDQIITFGTLNTKTYGDADFLVSATASSGLAVSFSASGTCTVTGSNVHISGAGSCTITANQSGNATYNPASDVPQSFTINKATPTATLSVSNSPVPYTGAGQSATIGISVSSVPGSVSNILTGGAATQTTVGTYAVTADFVPTDTTNYNSLTGLSAGNFVINKATPTATLSVSNSPVTYNGAGQSATVVISVSSVPGSVSNILTGGAATQTTVGTYAVTADFVPTDTTNYNSLTGLSAGNFVINKATPTATLSVSNSPVSYNGAGQSAIVGISASSVPGSVINILNGGAATQTNVGTYAVTADFVPTDTTNYNSLTGLSAGNFVINKATPLITWDNPADITYGTALSGTQLNAVEASSIAGTFVYTPASGTVLIVGAGQTLSVVFTPTDTTNYNSASKDVIINVNNKITPVITWSNPADITYGTALSGTQLNALEASSIPGTFAYTPASGTVLSAGATQTLHVDFTPTDTVNYNSASADVTINVLQATPIITWANPADITSGTALSATQLNALASVPGGFVYTPAAGFVLGAGAGQTLHVDFTPTDSTNYTIASADVTINVTGTLPEIRYINGTVTSSSPLHEALAGVTVTKGSDTAVTDSNGFYSFTVVVGTYDLTFDKNDIRYNTGSKNVIVDEAVENGDFELQLKPVGIITGTVRHTDVTTW
ncbi:MAG: hypothetical protein Q7J35_09190 [Candidatus Methanoperedens sp.]|nr:hypothetical protein [Candidatus Methanoperedens sp.]